MVFIAWHCAYTSTIVITAKAHSEWKTSHKASLLPGRIDHSDPMITSSFVTLKRLHLTLSPENSFYSMLPPVTGWHYDILSGLPKPFKRFWGVLVVRHGQDSQSEVQVLHTQVLPTLLQRSSP